MKYLLFIFSVTFFASCKKEYTCTCYSDRRGYIIEQSNATYKEKKKNKSKALSDCKRDYENSSNYVNGGYCEIK